MKSYRFIVKGIVQGVYYRKYTSTNASNANFNGYVKNLPSGDVEACVTCDDNDLDKFVDILKKGSPNSRVDSIEKSALDEIFKNGFDIRY